MGDSWLREMRERSGLSQREAARRIGISRSYYCKLENGKCGKRMSIETAYRIAWAMGFDVNDFVKKEWKE